MSSQPPVGTSPRDDPPKRRRSLSGSFKSHLKKPSLPKHVPESLKHLPLPKHIPESLQQGGLKFANFLGRTLTNVKNKKSNFSRPFPGGRPPISTTSAGLGRGRASKSDTHLPAGGLRVNLQKKIIQLSLSNLTYRRSLAPRQPHPLSLGADSTSHNSRLFESRVLRISGDPHPGHSPVPLGPRPQARRAESWPLLPPSSLLPRRFSRTSATPALPPKGGFSAS